MSDKEKVNRGVHTNSKSVPIISARPIPTTSESDTSVAVANNQRMGRVDFISGLDEDNNATCESNLETSIETAKDDKNLYRMIAVPMQREQVTPAKIEFKLHRPKQQKVHYIKRCHRRSSRKVKSCPCMGNVETKNDASQTNPENLQPNITENCGDGPHVNHFFSRICNSFNQINKNPFIEDEIPQPKEEQDSTDKSVVCEKIDIYYFDHLNAAYFRTTDCPPNIMSDAIAQRATHYATRFWAEIYGSLHIGVTFLIAFLLQSYRFVLYSIVRPLMVGFLQMSSDYFFKPLITIIFNGLIQPIFVFIFNMFSSVNDMLEPIANILDNFMKPIARVMKAIRLVSCNSKTEIQNGIPQKVQEV